MRKFLLAACAAGGLTASGGAAYAADPVEPVYDWNGFYLGAFAGYAFGDSDAKGDDGAFDEAGNETFDLSPDGFVAGGTLGFNWQVNSIVLGIEGELGYNDADDSEFVVPDPDNFAEVDFGFYGTLAARLGFAADNILFYGKVGGAFSEIDHRAGDLIDGTVTIDATDLGSVDETAFGFLLGAGIEWGVTDTWTVKAEYNYIDFEDLDDTNTDGDNFDFENEMHIVKLGVNFRF